MVCVLVLWIFIASSGLRVGNNSRIKVIWEPVEHDEERKHWWVNEVKEGARKMKKLTKIVEEWILNRIKS